MRLHLPLKGIGTIPGIYLTQKFAQNLQDYSQFGMKGHNGIDWAAPLGTPVLAAHDGFLIVKAIDDDGYGIYARVVWEEEGFSYESIYAHFQKVEGKNRPVKAGEVIGYVNSTGFSTGNHLHMGVRKLLNGSVVDYNNGYLGYFDPEPYWEKTMTKKYLIKDGSKIGILVVEGFTGTVVFAKDPTALAELSDALEIPADVKTVVLP